MDEESHLDGNSAIVLTMHYRGQTAPLQLSSIYGSFRFAVDEEVEPGSVTELLCPRCHRSVLIGSACKVCAARLARLRLAVGGEVFFCSRRGCKFHHIELSDPENSLVELTR